MLEFKNALTPGFELKVGMLVRVSPQFYIGPQYDGKVFPVQEIDRTDNTARLCNAPETWYYLGHLFIEKKTRQTPIKPG